MYYVVDLLGFLRNVEQCGYGLIPISREQLHSFD